MSQQVTTEQRKGFVSFWTAQRQAIEGLLSEETQYWFDVYTRHDNVGYETGQLRPGKFGQWDLHYWPTNGQIDCVEGEALIASGLSAEEVAEENRREECRQQGIDPDNPVEVSMFDRIQSMTTSEVDAAIEHLEEILTEP